jgi:hypothetical protein
MTDGRTTAGRQTKSDHKSSPCHFVTGELKIALNLNFMSFSSLFNYGIKLINIKCLLGQTDGQMRISS